MKGFTISLTKWLSVPENILLRKKNCCLRGITRSWLNTLKSINYSILHYPTSCSRQWKANRTGSGCSVFCPNGGSITSLCPIGTVGRIWQIVVSNSLELTHLQRKHQLKNDPPFLSGWGGIFTSLSFGMPLALIFGRISRSEK